MDTYWKKVRDLMVHLEIIDKNSPVNAKEATVLDFAVALKDGFSMCQFANTLEAGTVTRMHKNPQLQFLCFENIGAFLVACEKRFGLKKKELFTVDDLFYAADFGKVITTLSALTRCKQARNNPNIVALAPPVVQTRTDSHGDDGGDYDDIYEHLPSLVENVEPDSIYYDARMGVAPPSEVPSDKLDYEDVEDIYEALPAVQLQKMTLKLEQTVIPGVPQIDKRTYILDELLETERNYTRDLEVMVECFYDPCRQSNKWASTDIDIIFNNVVDLYKVHVHLLGKLQTAVVEEKGVDVARVFLAAVEDLMQYSQYCAYIEDADSKIIELCDKRPDFKEFLRQAKSRSGQNFALKDLIKTPMQRILRYPLLLGELLKKTDPDHRDHASLTSCLRSLKEVAVSINEAKRDRENMKNVMNLQGRLEGYNGPDLITMGKLVKDGEVEVRTDGEKKMKRRFVFLFDLGLIVCQLKGNSYVYKQTVMLSGHVLEDSGGHNVHAWILRNVKADKETIMFLCKTVEIKARWLTAFTAAISNTPDALVLMHRQKISDVRGTDDAPRQHELKMFTYSKATFCVHCQSLLWGIANQGFKCQGCGIDCHKRCISHIDPECRPRNLGRSSAPVSAAQPVSKKKSKIEKKKKGKEAMDLSWMKGNGSNASGDSSDRLATGSSHSSLRGGQEEPTTVQARYEFVAKDSNELSFSAGDLILLLDRSNPAWWKGRLEGNVGYFPSTYVVLQDGTAAAVEKKTRPSEKMTSSFLPSKGLGDASRMGVGEMPTAVGVVVPAATTGALTVGTVGMGDDGDYDMVEGAWQGSPWFFGKLSGDKAKSLLIDCEPGTFLVRESEGRPGDYSMSLKNLSSVKHVRIVQKANRYSLADTKYFNSIPEIVQTYLEESLEKYFPDLPVTLTGYPSRS